MYDNTLVVNLFAAPGSGKSTIAATVFSDLKWYGIDCELVSEFAKDLVWERRHDTFNDQLYLFAKQHHRIFRLQNKVRVVITDSPFLMGVVYTTYPYQFLRLPMYDAHKLFNNSNYFIKRVKPYNPNGRNQTQEESDELSSVIESMLIDFHEPYKVIQGDKPGACQITTDILTSLGLPPNGHKKMV